MEPEHNSNSHNNKSVRKTIFKCDLEDETLRQCIQAKLKEDKIRFYTDKPYEILDIEVLNCLDSGLVACFRPKVLERKYLSPIAEIIAKLDDTNTWIIEEINISVNLKTEDKDLLKEINNCLKVFKISCKLPDLINFYVIDKYEFDTLQNYKMELKDLEEELTKIKGNKTKREELYNLFKISSII